MPIVAYIANQFPSPVEPYVMEEIRELRRRGVEVIPCSARLPERSIAGKLESFSAQTIYLQPLQFGLLFSAVWLCLQKRKLLLDLFQRILWRGGETPMRRMRALLHTFLGACYALLLRGRGVEHIHVHHGYFASWIALVAARLLGISFSMTLHGSDLLLHPHYLETKLEYCKFCVTISEFNRRHILERYPDCDPGKILVERLGVSSIENRPALENRPAKLGLIMLAVGRLHPVKNYGFLLRACRLLKDRGIRFVCRIAGEGHERPSLERQIVHWDLQEEVQLLGHLSSDQLQARYEDSNLIVLTSHSEGVPVVLMEAMAYGKTVLAPAITGIPELVCDGKTGFLYRAESLGDFVSQVELIDKSQSALGPMRDAARRHVLDHFNIEKNVASFGDAFLKAIDAENNSYENSVLQQV
jgi:colanic acid/amylovoran biosynthesis glycosyltransferase